MPVVPWKVKRVSTLALKHSWKGNAPKMKLKLKFGPKFEFEFDVSKSVVLAVLALIC
jgi:hypothetical protein